MTLPARAVATGGPSAKKLSRKLLVSSLGARLAVAVGIVAAEPVALLERPARARVLVDLVAGDDHDALEMRELAAGLEQRARAEHVGGEGAERIAVGLAHQRLRRQVKDDLRIGAPRPRRAPARDRGRRAMIERSAPRGRTMSQRFGTLSGASA